jgi:hypothetical protein
MGVAQINPIDGMGRDRILADKVLLLEVSRE